MTAAELQDGIPSRGARRARVKLRLLHAGWLIFLGICACSMPELRGTPMGTALWIEIVGAIALLALGILARRRGGAHPPGSLPVFSVHTWLGLVMIGVGTFGVVDGWNSDLPGVFILIPGVGAPVSRQFFIIACIFGGTALYGALVVALGSGLVIRHAPMQAKGPMAS